MGRICHNGTLLCTDTKYKNLPVFSQDELCLCSAHLCSHIQKFSLSNTGEFGMREITHRNTAPGVKPFAALFGAKQFCILEAGVIGSVGAAN